MPTREKSDKGNYSEGEKVLCFHGPLLYEARCVNVEIDGDESRYFVHYQGWNKTWDEWVTDDRIIKFNDAGLKKQSEYQDKYKESRKNKTKKKSSSSNDDKRRRGIGNKSDRSKKIGSASEASNHSIIGSEDGHHGPPSGGGGGEEDEMGEEDVRTDAGTSIVSDEMSHFDELKSTTRGDTNKAHRRGRGGGGRTSVASNSSTRGRKRKISINNPPSEDGTAITNITNADITTTSDDKLELDEEEDDEQFSLMDCDTEDKSVTQEKVSNGNSNSAYVSSNANNNNHTTNHPTAPTNDTKTTSRPSVSRSRKKVLVPLDENITDLEAYSNSINIDTLQFTLSEKLRFWLTDDWDLVTRQSRLCNVPARLTVNDVLGRYRIIVDQNDQPFDSIGDTGATDNTTESHNTKMREMRMELIDGLKKYFNVSVGSMLLYKFERQQYFDVINKSSATKNEMSSMYGAIYILRLLVNIQKLVTYTRTDKLSLQCLSDLLQHFVDFLDVNSDEFFKLEDYITASADYTRRAMC